MKRIVILGGGYGGITAAKKLGRIFRKNSDIEITLIDKNTYHTLMTELHEVAGSRVDPDSVMISYDRIFTGSHINIVTDVITSLDTEKKQLVSAKAVYPYDYLIIGTGGAPEFFDIQGIQENSFSLWSLEDAIRITAALRRALPACREGARRRSAPADAHLCCCRCRLYRHRTGRRVHGTPECTLRTL